MISGNKKCINGHFYKETLSQCPYCIPSYNYDFYICYYHKDYPIIKMVVEKLREIGKKVFFDDFHIHTGNEALSMIQSNIKQSRILLFFLSPEERPLQCEEELKFAQTIGKRICTITLDNTSDEKADIIIQRILEEISNNSSKLVSPILLSDDVASSSLPTSPPPASKTMIIDDGYDSSTYRKKLLKTRITTFDPSTKRIAGVLHELLSNNHTYLISEGQNFIGRDKNCNITINESSVSGIHALLLFRFGKYYIKDLRSINGTYVNGECIKLNPKCINNGDIIRIGNLEFVFEELDHYQYTEEQQPVYSSVFAPAEIKKHTHMLVQVYLHLFEETEKVKSLAQESQKDAERRDYLPLQCILKKGDKVDIQLNIYGETLLMSEKKSIIWQGSFTKCSFNYFVPKEIDFEELSCMAMLTVNGAIVGEMRFITKIVEQPKNLNPKVFAHQYHKIFISYAHQDIEKVEQMARAYQAQGVEYFFDRHSLMPGDIFPLKIQEFIDTADLFILCWSANAAKSEYVELERQRALRRAFPQVQPLEKAELSIYPMSIEPRAELPVDMIGKYNFEMV